MLTIHFWLSDRIKTKRVPENGGNHVMIEKGGDPWRNYFSGACKDFQRFQLCWIKMTTQLILMKIVKKMRILGCQPQPLT